MQFATAIQMPVLTKRDKLALIVKTQPLGSLLELALLQANLLKQSKARSPVAKAFLVRSKSSNILGLEKEAIVDVPWRSLDLSLLVQNALMFNASGLRRGRRRRRRRRDMRTVCLARESPPLRITRLLCYQIGSRTGHISRAATVGSHSSNSSRQITRRNARGLQGIAAGCCMKTRAWLVLKACTPEPLAKVEAQDNSVVPEVQPHAVSHALA